MTKTSTAQRNAILRAHSNAGTEEAGTAVYWARGYVHVVERTAKVLLREDWVTGTLGYGPYPVTAAGLIAAGVDMDAIHGEALHEESVRELDRVALEQASPRARRFNAAVVEGKSYRSALEILHAEALNRRPGCEGGMWCRCDASTPCPVRPMAIPGVW